MITCLNISQRSRKPYDVYTPSHRLSLLFQELIPNTSRWKCCQRMNTEISKTPFFFSW